MRGWFRCVLCGQEVHQTMLNRHYEDTHSRKGKEKGEEQSEKASGDGSSKEV